MRSLLPKAPLQKRNHWPEPLLSTDNAARVTGFRVTHKQWVWVDGELRQSRNTVLREFPAGQGRQP